MKNKESHFLRTYKHDLTETVHEWSLDGPLQSLPYLCDFKIQIFLKPLNHLNGNLAEWSLMVLYKMFTWNSLIQDLIGKWIKSFLSKTTNLIEYKLNNVHMYHIPFFFQSYGIGCRNDQRIWFTQQFTEKYRQYILWHG
jgi:hypothetical protein